MIQLQNVNKIYPGSRGDITALQDINLQVARGEIFGVIGRSGAGKSSLVRCVNLLERPTSGSVSIDDIELTELTAPQLRQVRHRIGMVFQHFNLLSSRTVYDNIALPLELLKQSKQQIKKAVEPLLALTGLNARRDAFPAQLSGGQKQRVAIARALATKPDVLLCDEMTSALDPETTESILRLINDINQEFHLSILLITHEMQVVKSIADRVAVMDKGRIIERADVVELFKHPKTEVAKTFTQSVLKGHLSESLLRRITPQADGENASMIVRIAFIGETATQPVIDALIQNANIQVNILQADLEFLHHDTIGILFVAVRGASGERERALHYLQDLGLESEVLGYVTLDVSTVA
ncbi:MAG: ATP-binding cassette domain-containing protein [Gammaproteobacteria bacterium]|nr:ATP-binding cassette domain-containing protein [Gammaproteobacteria bacterium]